MNKSPERPRVFVIHTSFVSVQYLGELFAELVPSAVVRHIVDDSLLPEVLAAGGVTPGVRHRMTGYYKAAEEAGADVIFNQCSSVGDVADEAAAAVGVPVIRIDRRMAEAACRAGTRVGVVATLETTLRPTCRLLRAVAANMGKPIVIEERLVPGAFDALIAGERAQHNASVLAAIAELIRVVDVVVCAQGSMAAIVSELGTTPVPVLTSPRMGVESVAAFLKSGSRTRRADA